jgi:hypothetical protein
VARVVIAALALSFVAPAGAGVSTQAPAWRNAVASFTLADRATQPNGPEEETLVCTVVAVGNPFSLTKEAFGKLLAHTGTDPCATSAWTSRTWPRSSSDRNPASASGRGAASGAVQYGRGEAMSTVVDAVYEDGVFKPEHPVDLNEKTKVHLVIETASPQAEDDDPTGWKTAMELMGCIKDAPEGEPIARDHDKHLYK